MQRLVMGQRREKLRRRHGLSEQKALKRIAAHLEDFGGFRLTRFDGRAVAV
jgi:hypothetical protein